MDVLAFLYFVLQTFWVSTNDSNSQVADTTNNKYTVNKFAWSLFLPFEIATYATYI